MVKKETQSHNITPKAIINILCMQDPAFVAVNLAYLQECPCFWAGRIYFSLPWLTITLKNHNLKKYEYFLTRRVGYCNCKAVIMNLITFQYWVPLCLYVINFLTMYCFFVFRLVQNSHWLQKLFYFAIPNTLVW